MMQVPRGDKQVAKVLSRSGRNQGLPTARDVDFRFAHNAGLRVNEVLPEQYVWLISSAAFLIPWVGAYAAFPRHQKAMLWASLFTTPIGLTEPLFVPEYWSPPSLFDLARTTGFDIESQIFSFGIGGIGAVRSGSPAGTGCITGRSRRQ
jgi:hypothetical protein